MAINSEENIAVISLSVLVLGYFFNPQSSILKVYKT